MTDRPIIFSASMVRALLAGHKTQTRRLAASPLRRCEMGDRLYVREAWRTGLAYEDLAPRDMGGEEAILFEADGVTERWHRGCSEPGRLRTSMHMPRWASRLTLTVTDVRVEPLQAMDGQHPSESDAIAEGVHRIHHGDGEYYYHAFRDEPHPQNWCWPEDAFRELWDTLHTREGERWEDNPQVVALTFTVEHANIDRIGDRHD